VVATAQIAGLATPRGNQISVGRLLLGAHPALNIDDHPGSTMRAIEKVL
jgi:hypothetical protein